MNIFRVIKEDTKPFANNTAVIDGNCEVSYETLILAAEKIARSLKEKGVAPFHRVGLLCDNNIDYISISLAILSLSAVIVPISQEYPEEEIDLILSDINVDFFLFKKNSYNLSDTDTFLFNSFSKIELFIKRFPAREKMPEDYYKTNPAFIRFSSGTTSKSKGVLLSHESIIERTDAADKGLRITPEDSILWVLSMSHHFVVTILLFLRRAATIILCKTPFPDSLEKGIHNVTLIYASPFHYGLLIQLDLLDPKVLQGMRLAISTTMKLPENTANEFYSKFNLNLSEAYGIIEVGLPFINFSADKNKRTSVGKILPDYEIKIVDQDADGIGKIYLKGKGMLDAYFSPWRKREDILENGWFRTGDLGRIDESGYLTIVGRQENTINFAGKKIFPLEVEAVVNQYPLIKECFIYGEAHPSYGQLPMARIVLKEGADEMLDLHDLRFFCYKRLARYKVPKEFSCVDHLPKTVTGKIKR